MCRRLWGALAALLLAATGAMGATPPPDGAAKPSEVVWNLESGGLLVSISATKDLNFAYGSSLALTACLYQLSDMSRFTTLAGQPGGVPQLLSGNLDVLGGTGVTSMVLRLQPGEQRTLTLDRAEGAKYVAVAAGYAHQDASRCTGYLAFPVVQTRLRRRKVAYTAGKLAAKVLLGADTVTLIGGQYE